MTALEINTLDAKCKPKPIRKSEWADVFDNMYGPPDPYERFQEWVRPMLRRSKSAAQKKGRTFDLDAEFLASLAKAQHYCCAVTRLPFTIDLSRYTKGRRDPFSPSIDRIDNRRGYERDNVRLVWLIVNLGRADFCDIAFLRMAHAVASRYPAPPLNGEWLGCLAQRVRQDSDDPASRLYSGCCAPSHPQSFAA